MAIDERKIMNGTHGSVFLDGEEIAEVKAFQAKLEFQKEEVKVAGRNTLGVRIIRLANDQKVSSLCVTEATEEEVLEENNEVVENVETTTEE